MSKEAAIKIINGCKTTIGSGAHPTVALVNVDELAEKIRDIMALSEDRRIHISAEHQKTYDLRRLLERAEAEIERLKIKADQILKEDSDYIALLLRKTEADILHERANTEKAEAEIERLKIEAGQHPSECEPEACGKCRRDREISRLMGLLEKTEAEILRMDAQVKYERSHHLSALNRAETAEVEIKRLHAVAQFIREGKPKPALPTPVPMRLPCPSCGALHVDEGEFAPGGSKPHHTHACQECGAVWRPAIVETVGVRFLPGFKDYKWEPVLDTRVRESILRRQWGKSFRQGQVAEWKTARPVYKETCLRKGCDRPAVSDPKADYCGGASCGAQRNEPKTCGRAAASSTYAPCSRPPHNYQEPCAHHLAACPAARGMGTCDCTPGGMT